MSAEHDMSTAKPFDEMRAADATVRAHYQPYADWLEQTPRECIARKRKEADVAFHRVGITFNVYGAEERHGTADPLRTCCRASSR
jgi:uncharacterized circularly permuted ATP-grasp superfamily protein